MLEKSYAILIPNDDKRNIECDTINIYNNNDLINIKNYNNILILRLNNKYIKFRNNTIPKNVYNLFFKNCKFKKIILQQKKKYIIYNINFLNIQCLNSRFNHLLLYTKIRLNLVLYECRFNYKFKQILFKNQCYKITKNHLIYMLKNNKFIKILE